MMVMMQRLALVLASLALDAWAGQGAVPPPADTAKGKAIAATVCVACHGPDGNSTAATFPKLAGQHAGYLLKQLRNFKAPEGSPERRVNALMNGMVAPLSDQDLRNVAAFYATQPYKPEVARNRETLEAAQKLWRAGDFARGIPACAGCHGPAGAGLPVQFPRLSGQFPEYAEAQLKAFRSGERANDPNRMMRIIAARLSDAEIKAIADFAAGLR
ncbi:MAG: c-type cytochrome [Rhodocyclaceae bacterium]